LLKNRRWPQDDQQISNQALTDPALGIELIAGLGRIDWLTVWYRGLAMLFMELEILSTVD
jgi:hypothetical protein